MCVVSQMYIFTKIPLLGADIRAKKYFRCHVEYY